MIIIRSFFRVLYIFLNLLVFIIFSLLFFYKVGYFGKEFFYVFNVVYFGIVNIILIKFVFLMKNC